MSRALRTVLTLALISFDFAAASTPSAAEAWNFDVSLDGKPIGYHRFQINELGDQLELLSEARFNVKFLFFNAYRYTHTDRELWRDGCLDRIAAQTDDNGVRRAVHGAQEGKTFRLIADKQSSSLGPCVMTFAYWNPGILEATQLLNPQTGEYVPVRITRAGADSIEVRGMSRDAVHYRIDGSATGGRLVIDLWYSTDKEWLALESTTEDGRRLRYRLQ